MASVSDDDRIGEYTEAAIAHGLATNTGDSRSANAAHDRIASIYRALRAEGERERLLPLLDHRELSVRCWAAAHALEFAPEQAEPILEFVAKHEAGLVGFSAKQTLVVWRTGELSFP